MLARRAQLTDPDSDAQVLTAHLLAEPWAAAGHTVAAYVPIGREPGSVALLHVLVDRGVRVLLPVVAGPSLDWTAYDGTLRSGPWGLQEPVGTPLGREVLTQAAAVLVPALAVDRRGTRLGRGAGFYDRALRYARPDVPVLALLHDGELLDEPLPAEPHDVPVNGAVTPSYGVVVVGLG